MALLVLDVWLGVVDRYYFRWQLNWPEAFARYLMIWAALLAISAGIARRDHIGLMSFVGRLPMRIRRGLLIFADLGSPCIIHLSFCDGRPIRVGRLPSRGNDLRGKYGSVLHCRSRGRILGLSSNASDTAA
jgi:hypothetical protein